ncbi:MAG: hypothetical protein ABSG89_01755 [Bacteroidales bacterium]|jgi:hypothetical protein
MKRLCIIILLFAIAAFRSANGQDVSVSAVFDTSRIYIGDQTHYTVTLNKPAGMKLSLRQFRDTLCKNIEIISGPVSDSIKTGNDRIKITNRYLITCFDSGYYQVPPAYAEIKEAGGIRRFYSEYSPIEVIRVKIAPADSTIKIFDIIKPYRAPLTLGEILPWILIALLGASLISGIIFLIKKYWKRGIETEPVKNPDPAHVIAFRELEKLRNDQVWQKGEIKQYYSRLTEILRQYLENRYGIFSLEMTTSETLEELLKTGFRKDEKYNLLKNILNGSDLVKFAKYKPEPDENEVHFDNSWKFVDMTKVIEETASMVTVNPKREDKP